MPDGLSPDTWMRCLHARDAKMASEELLRSAAEALRSAEAVAAAAAAEHRAGAKRVAALKARRDDITAASSLELLDLEATLTLRQGRVEMTEDQKLAHGFDDYSDAVFLHRAHIEVLNEDIRRTGADKVDVIKKQAAGRLDIYKLQWEQKRDQMREEDLQQKIQAGGSLRTSTRPMLIRRAESSRLYELPP